MLAAGDFGYASAKTIGGYIGILTVHADCVAEGFVLRRVGGFASYNASMWYQALATDYDGTLATHGIGDENAVAALGWLAASGRKLLLVTGRELPDLKRVFPQYAIFDRVVAENGAVLYEPASDRESLLCEPAAQALIAALRAQKVPISVGRAIVATSEAHHQAVQQVIDQAGLQLEVKLNKGSLMVLPSGVTKATGLKRALQEMAVSAQRVVGIGDAENDLDLLQACGYAVAVANALPAVKSCAHSVTAGTHGAGVLEVVGWLLANDVAGCSSRAGVHLSAD